MDKIYSQWTYCIRNLETGKIEMAHYDSLRYVPSNLRIESKDKERACIIPEDHDTTAKDETEEVALDDFAQSMFEVPPVENTAQIGKLEPQAQEQAQPVEAQDQRPARDRRPPIRLQVDGNARQRYDEQ